jgi:hypothetical protein
MNWVFKLLEKMGRKYAYVDFYGDVLFYRYYPFFFEDNEDERFIGKMPNLFIHHYPGNPEGDGPDGENPHAHPWSSIGFIVKGGYEEIVNSSEYRVTKRFKYSKLSYNDYHQLVKVTPGTISFFFHGFRSSTWKLHLKKCETKCSICQEKNISCMKSEDKVVELKDYMQETNKDGWRSTVFIKCDENFETKLKIRKQALEKLGKSIARNMPEKRQSLKNHIYETFHDEKTKV